MVLIQVLEQSPHICSDIPMVLTSARAKAGAPIVKAQHCGLRIFAFLSTFDKAAVHAGSSFIWDVGSFEFSNNDAHTSVFTVHNSARSGKESAPYPAANTSSGHSGLNRIRVIIRREAPII